MRGTQGGGPQEQSPKSLSGRTLGHWRGRWASRRPTTTCTYMLGYRADAHRQQSEWGVIWAANAWDQKSLGRQSRLRLSLLALSQPRCAVPNGPVASYFLSESTLISATQSEIGLDRSYRS